LAQVANSVAKPRGPQRPHAFNSFFKLTAACNEVMVLLMGKFGTTNEGLYLLPKGIKVRSAPLCRIETKCEQRQYSAQESRREGLPAQHERLFF
jgi:hypothetical protein